MAPQRCSYSLIIFKQTGLSQAAILFFRDSPTGTHIIQPWMCIYMYVYIYICIQRYIHHLYPFQRRVANDIMCEHLSFFSFSHTKKSCVHTRTHITFPCQLRQLLSDRCCQYGSKSDTHTLGGLLARTLKIRGPWHNRLTCTILVCGSLHIYNSIMG